MNKPLAVESGTARGGHEILLRLVIEVGAKVFVRLGLEGVEPLIDIVDAAILVLVHVQKRVHFLPRNFLKTYPKKHFSR
jgi:hypothetical protein